MRLGPRPRQRIGPQWLRVWILSLGATIALLASMELYARHRGLEPLIRNSPDQWSLRRHEARTAGDDLVAFVGASRLTHAINLDAAARFRRDAVAVQLGLEGAGVLPMVQSLADDPQIRGLVVVSWSPVLIERDAHERAEAFTSHFDLVKDRFGRRIETHVDLWLEQNIVIFRSNFRLLNVVSHLLSTGVPQNLPPASVLHPDGSQPTPKTVLVQRTLGTIGVDSAMRWIGHRMAERVGLKEWNLACAQLLDAIAKLRSRGVEVVFIRMPSSGPYAAVEEEFYPRARYWDRFVELAEARLGTDPGWKAVHYADEPALRRFETADWSHISAEDQVAFTQALGSVIGGPDEVSP